MTPSGADEPGDLTRKERREAARAERKAAEEAHAAGAQRRTRLIQLGGVAGVVVVAIVVILIATSGSGKHTIGKSGSKVATENTRAVTALLSGIEQKGDTLGKETAPVTLQYFGDLECPVCQQFTEGALKPVIEKWVRGGKLRIEYRSLETATQEKEVFDTQQVAALAAGQQNKMWNYLELFYKEQGAEDSGYVTEEYLHKLAEGVPGLNLTTWASAREDTGLTDQVNEDAQAANAQGFKGTPAFLIGHTGGAMKPLEPGSLTETTGFDTAIEKLI